MHLSILTLPVILSYEISCSSNFLGRTSPRCCSWGCSRCCSWELTHRFINRLKHLSLQVQDKESGHPQEVTNQHTPPSLIACLVGLKDSPGSPHQEETLGAELVIKGDPQKVLRSSHSNPFKWAKKCFFFLYISNHLETSRTTSRWISTKNIDNENWYGLYSSFIN